jgi:alpha-L-rhamnosidase
MTQTGQILSVQNGLGNDEKAKEMLMKLLDDNDGKLCTGFVGTPLLCETLSMLGLNNYAWNLLFNEEYPGWLFEVNHGATTIWERWNSLDENGHITGTGMNSLNHYSYGSIVEWIYKYCAGIQSLTPGFAKVRIAPLVHHKLGHVDCVYPSASGTYEVHWSILDVNHLRVCVTVPYGCEAQIVLPYFEVQSDHENNPLTKGTVQAGTYEIVYETSRPLKDVIDLNTITAAALANEKIREYLEKLPLFAQTEFSMQSVQLHKALEMVSIVDPAQKKQIEKDLFAIQMDD